MELIAAVVLAGAFLAAVVLLLSRLTAWARSRGGGARMAPKAGERSCPLCSSVLEPGERVKSKLFPGTGDRIMHIFGCVHCWPATPSSPRICPVCGATLDAEGWVMARYFERPGVPGLSPGRRHVHVLGCTGCRRK